MSHQSPMQPKGSAGQPSRRVTAQVMKTNAEGFHDLVHLADAVVIEFSREGVEAGLIGDSLDRLMLLTDSAEYLKRFESRVMFSFDGYNNDPREIYEIPECARFFGRITKAWPYWFHFIAKDSDCVALLLLMMVSARQQESLDKKSMLNPEAAIREIHRRGEERGVVLDPEVLGVVLQEGFDGMNSLHDHMGVPGVTNMDISEKFGRALDTALNARGV